RAAEGLVDRLEDPYASLFTPEELEAFTVAYEGHYAGVGMLIQAQEGAPVVQGVFPNTPAERLGVQVGDRIVAIDGESVRAWELEKVANALKGEAGSKVRVAFLRYGVERPIAAAITRAVVRIPAVPYATIVDGDGGHRPLQQCDETAAEEVATSVALLVREGAEAVVLTRRAYGVGIVDEAVDNAGLCLPRGSEVARQSD